MSDTPVREVSRRDFLKTTGAASAAALAGATWGDVFGDEAKLPLRVLGKTGVKVPVLGLGTASAGHRPRKEASEFYDRAISMGVTYMDTAPEFAGYGVAQVALGDVLKDRRKEVFLVTKCYEPDGEKALALLKQNLKELQTDHADVVYAHSIGADRMDLKTVMGPTGVMKALEKARADGLCRFVGISGHNKPAKFLEVLKEFDVQVMMNAVSFVSRHIYNFEEKVWPVAREKNVGLVAMKVLGGTHQLPTDPKDQPRGKGGRVRGDEVPLAFRYAMGLPGLTAVVLGCYDLPELEQAVGWAKSFEPLPPEQQEQLLARGKELAKQWGAPYGPAA